MLFVSLRKGLASWHSASSQAKKSRQGRVEAAAKRDMQEDDCTIYG